MLVTMVEMVVLVLLLQSQAQALPVVVAVVVVVELPEDREVQEVAVKVVYQGRLPEPPALLQIPEAAVVEAITRQVATVVPAE